jgi:hypothetical protein
MLQVVASSADNDTAAALNDGARQASYATSKWHRFEAGIGALFERP